LELYEKIFEFTPDGLLVVDGQGRIARANAQALRMFGYTREALLGQPIELLVPERFRERHVVHRTRFLADPGPRGMGVGMQLVGRRADGSELPVEVMLGALPAGGDRQVLAVVRNVSERRAIEAERLRLAAIVDSASDAIIGRDLQGTVRTWNRAAERLFGWRADEIVGRDMSLLVPADLPDEQRATFERLRRGERVEQHVTVRQHKDGTRIPVLLSAAPVADAEGAVVGAATIVHDLTERTQAEAALRLSEERYRTVVEQASDGIFIADREGRYTEVNPAGAAMLGYTREEVCGLTIADLVDPDEVARVAPEVARLLAGETVCNTWRFRRRDGTPLVGEVLARQLSDGRLLGVVRDVSERMRVQEALRRSEAGLAEAQALAKVGSWELDLRDNVLTWSDEVYRIFERPREGPPLTYEAFLDTVHPDDRERVDRVYFGAVRAGAEYEVEHRLLLPDGRVKHVHERGKTVYDAAGTALRTIGTTQDITERRVAELKRAENEAMLAAVIDTASDAIISTDADGRVTLFNPAAERIFGVRAEAMLGQGVESLLPPRARAAHAGEMRAFAASHVAGRNMSVGRVQGVGAGGALLELESSISQVTIGGRKILTAMLRDVTERVQHERALAKNRLELSELALRLMDQERATSHRLAQSLHDRLGQTLTAMRIDFVTEARFDDPRQAARHARVDRLIDEAVREVRQVLVELRPTLLAENGLYAALDNEIRSRHAGANGVRLEIVAPPALRTQRWAEEVEYAAFMVAREALTNALHHARAAQVRLTLGGDAHALTLEVVDDGCGLAPGHASVRPGHLGMVGMRERSLAIGARFEAAARPEGGTVVRMAWEGGA
jgi:PAS domain S-box-containing protein